MSAPLCVWVRVCECVYWEEGGDKCRRPFKRICVIHQNQKLKCVKAATVFPHEMNNYKSHFSAKPPQCWLTKRHRFAWWQWSGPHQKTVACDAGCVWAQSVPGNSSSGLLGWCLFPWAHSQASQTWPVEREAWRGQRREAVNERARC